MKTPGQIAYDAWTAGPSNPEWGKSRNQKAWEDSAQAVLSSQWRSVDDPPDDVNQKVVVAHLCNDEDDRNVCCFDSRDASRTHWMPIPTLPNPTDEEKVVLEFEGWWNHSASPDLPSKDAKFIAFTAFKAARKSKEVKP